MTESAWAGPPRMRSDGVGQAHGHQNDVDLAIAEVVEDGSGAQHHRGCGNQEEVGASSSPFEKG
jgi:hypothetical protein